MSGEYPGIHPSYYTQLFNALCIFVCKSTVFKTFDLYWVFVQDVFDCVRVFRLCHILGTTLQNKKLSQQNDEIFYALLVVVRLAQLYMCKEIRKHRFRWMFTQKRKWNKRGHEVSRRRQLTLEIQILIKALTPLL